MSINTDHAAAPTIANYPQINGSAGIADHATPTTLYYGMQPLSTEPIIIRSDFTEPTAPATPINPERAAVLDEIDKYETLKTIARVAKIAGLVLMIAGLSSAALFFGLPVISVIIGTAFVTLPLIAYAYIKFGLHGPNGVMNPFSQGSFGRVLTEIFWKLPANYVYSAKAATVVGVATGIMTGVGAVLYAAGSYAESYCDNKITVLKAGG